MIDNIPQLDRWLKDDKVNGCETETTIWGELVTTTIRVVKPGQVYITFAAKEVFGRSVSFLGRTFNYYGDTVIFVKQVANFMRANLYDAYINNYVWVNDERYSEEGDDDYFLFDCEHMGWDEVETT